MTCQSKIQFDELLRWMAEKQCTFRQLGELSGLDKMTLSRLANGTFKRLNRNTIPAISKATQGAVDERAFVDFLGRLSRAGRIAA